MHPWRPNGPIRPLSCESRRRHTTPRGKPAEAREVPWRPGRTRTPDPLLGYDLYIVRSFRNHGRKEARAVTKKMIDAAARYLERTAPAALKRPVAWIDSDHLGRRE